MWTFNICRLLGTIINARSLEVNVDNAACVNPTPPKPRLPAATSQQPPPSSLTPGVSVPWGVSRCAPPLCCCRVGCVICGHFTDRQRYKDCILCSVFSHGRDCTVSALLQYEATLVAAGNHLPAPPLRAFGLIT